MKTLGLIGVALVSLLLLALVEVRYRRGVYGPLQEVGMLVSLIGLLMSLGGVMARL
jgi:hypothetical protein